MLPIGDDNRARRTFPFVTYLLIAVNLLVFFLELAGGDAFINYWSFIPARLTQDPGIGFLSIFTSMFMHAGWMHLLGNMLYLGIFGDNVEDRMGHIRFLFFYLLCGVAATFAQYIFMSNSSIPNLGASGAIAGVLGSYLLLFPRGRVYMLILRSVTPVPAWVALGFWIVIQLISGAGSLANAGASGGVAYMAHIGGFFAGLLFTLPFRQRYRYLPPQI
jgi:membrane associated rhomboid family serine protease